MQPLKSDFPTYVQFSTNIEDRLLDFQIKAAYTKDLKIKFGAVMEEIYNADYQTVDDFVTAEPELGAFYRDYILEHWILSAYKRFIAHHGLNVTQFGLTKQSDPDGTFTQSTGDERAIIMRQINHDISITETEVFRKLEDVNWTFDGDTYETKRVRTRKSFGIHAIGGEYPDDELEKKLKYGDFR